ncbi:MAG: hypothetical protein HS115_01785 [Spirochaetales bacterium]|nr:hypothetical protein [Spirochaetales bacterium]
MTDHQFEFWRKWLLYCNILIVGLGVLIAFAGNSILFEMHNSGSRATFFEGKEFPADVLAFKNWLFGIIGGTIVGFHILMIFLIAEPFRRRERWSYQALWAGLLSWFVIDSSVSLFYGAVYNVVLINLVALVSIGLPLVMTARAFRRPQE